MQLFKDRIGSGGPAKRLCIVVVGSHEVIDPLDQLFNAGKRASTYGLAGDQSEEALHLIQP